MKWSCNSYTLHKGQTERTSKQGERRKPATTYILNALLVDSFTSFTGLLTNHNALQLGVNHGDAKRVVEGHNLHL